MMTHLTRNVAAAMTPQSAIAVKQRTQAGEVSTPADSSDQYNFAELFGQASNQQKYVTKAAPGSTAAGAAAALASASAAAATSASTATPSSNTSTPGIEALVSAIMKGTFKSSNVTDPSQLQETTPAGTDTMPNFYYADNQTASELANLLGGSVVQMPAFGQDKGWTEPNANFIELPNGQTFNAADVAYYRDMVTVIRDRVMDQIRKGKSLADVKEAGLTKDYDGRYGSSDSFIEAAYKSLKK